MSTQLERDFVIINIGRNTKDGPLTKVQWLAFQDSVRNYLYGEVVGQGRGSSEYNGIKEDMAFFHVLANVSEHEANEQYLSRLAGYMHQETIAYVISTQDSLITAAQPLNAYL